MNKKKWIYVRAYFASKLDLEDGLISFKHIFVESACDEDAYCAGHAKMKSPKKFLNDYVVELPNAISESILDEAQLLMQLSPSKDCRAFARAVLKSQKKK
jgi:hypothetical protein